jgi:hypothetical protein
MAFDVADLSPQQLKEYTNKRTSYFKGTIAVACIYGTLALVMFLIAIFSPTGKTIITDQMLPFTIAFVGGMIIVVILLLVAIFTTKPPPHTVFSYDNMKCPDYWTLSKTPDSMLNSYEGSERAQLAWRCIRNNTTSLNRLENKSVTARSDRAKMMSVMSKPYQTSSFDFESATSGQLNCNVVYPDYMNYHDMKYDKNDPANPNRLRCAYAEACGVPWSSVCPSRGNMT